MKKPLLETLKGQKQAVPPIWFMRQAGRHLPEYMELRSEAKDFVDFCFRPDMAAEATLQPIRRYDMDGAILFADILLIPIGLGRDVRFIKGTGPVLDPISLDEINDLTTHGAAERISNVFETVSRVRSELSDDKTLIGFCGGAWTVGTYMIEGGGSPTKYKSKRMALESPQEMQGLLNAIADSSADYLVGQVKAGADAVKIFESWAEGLSEDIFERCVIAPTRRMIKRVRDQGVTVPIIGFPKGAGTKTKRYIKETGINVVAAGTDMPLADLRDMAGPDMPIQGNLDPITLAIGGDPLREAVDHILNTATGPHIFNLGHGVTPDVKIEEVHNVIRQIRSH